MRRTALVLLATAVVGAAQDPGPFRIRIETSREGLTRVSCAALAALHPLTRVRPDKLCLTLDGAPVALHVQGGADDRLDPADDLFFFAPAPRHPQAKTETFILTDQGRPWFYRPGEPDPDARASDPDAARVRVVQRFEEKRVFDPLSTLRSDVLRGPARPSWWTASLPPGGTAEAVFAGDLAPIRNAPAELVLEFFGALADGVPQRVKILVNGVEAATAAWETPLEHTVTAAVPGSALRASVGVKIESQTQVTTFLEPGDDLGRPKQNRLLLRSATLAYESRLVSPSTARKQTVTHLSGSGSKAPRRLAIESRIQNGFQVFDPVAARMWRGTEIFVADDRDIPLAIVTADGGFEPESVARLAPTRAHLEAGGDYVIVCASRFRKTIEPLANARANEGFTPVTVEARSLYDAFGAGRATPAAIKAFLVEAHARWKIKPRFLLLVGDADFDVAFLSEKETIPAFLTRTAYNGATATDAPFGDLDDDGTPEIAVGRLPVRTPEDLLVVVRRLVAADSAPSGLWRRRAEFFAGEGRFGPMVDKLIETVVGNLVAKEIPPQFSVGMTYGNPRSAWYWPAPSFNDAVIDAFNRGSVFFTYVGHGYPEGCDRVEYGGRRYPILSSPDVSRLDAGGRSGLVALIACSTGRFDDPERDCLAEKLLVKEGGPLAVLASSRISHPFANALLGQGLVKSAFDPEKRIGEIVIDAKRRMIAESKGMLATLARPHLSKAVDLDPLVRDHVSLYNLFGDPASRIPFARPLEGLEAPDTAAAGAKFAVAVKHGATSGDAVLFLERPRAALLKSKGGEPDDEAGVKKRHAAANDVEVARVEGKVESGSWTAEITAPADLPPGDYLLVAFVAGTNGAPDSIASRPLKVEAPQAPPPLK
jgi:hypothetical protein